jgi:NADPH:quinone reductase-like Zn-dependent oxidoreductase
MSLKRQEDERETMLGSLGRLYTAGYPLNWAGVFSGPRRFVELPLYAWQRERCWFESEESRTGRLTAPAHPLLGRPNGGPIPTWDVRLDLQLFPSLADHRVQHAVIFPAAAFLEMAFAAAREVHGQIACQLEDVTLAQPCYLFADKPLQFRTSFDPDTAAVQIHGRDAQGEQEWTLHFRAVIRALTEQSDVSRKPIAESRLRDNGRAYSSQECYDFLHKLGLDYGPAFQGIEQGWQGESEALGMIASPSRPRSEGGYLFHPALLDACFQVAVSADRSFPADENCLYLPVNAEQIRVWRPAANRLWSHARLREKNATWSVADIDIYDDSDSLVAQVRGLRSRRVAGDAENSLDLLYAYQWQTADLPTTEGKSEPGTWLIFTDRSGVGKQLAEKFRAEGDQCILVYPAQETSEVFKTSDVCRLLQDVPSWKGLIHLWNLDSPPPEALTALNLDTAQDDGLLSILNLVQGWDKACGDPAAPLFLVTRGAQSVSSDTELVAVAQSPVIGLGRVIISEYPRLRCKLIDLDPAEEISEVLKTSEVCRLVHELTVADDEDEIAFRGPNRFVHRYQKYVPKDPANEPALEGSPYRLGLSSPTSVEGLIWQKMVRQPPGTGEVEIQIRAGALNFSDVLKVLGLYPGMADGAIPLGAECSGVVTAVGDGVSDWNIGDEVLAVAPFAFASRVLTRVELVVRKPLALNFEEAASLPIAFLTASYAVEHLGRLRPGERILIHSASGGVGLAAIQLARRAGAEIFATAGTSQKRDFLRSLGIEHVMDSRTLIFADQVLEHTGGHGVDMILNSLAGEAISRGLAALADHGRFLEIGKRDIYQNSRLGLKPFQKNLSFFTIDLDRIMRDRPQLLGELLRKTVSDINAGLLQPLPVQVFPIAGIHDAFRTMQQGKHIGKIALSMNERPSTIIRAEDEPISFRAGGTYLITGGLGGFGLAVARWLVERGARHLILMGRRGGQSHRLPTWKNWGPRSLSCQATSPMPKMSPPCSPPLIAPILRCGVSSTRPWFWKIVSSWIWIGTGCGVCWRQR